MFRKWLYRVRSRILNVVDSYSYLGWKPICEWLTSWDLHIAQRACMIMSMVNKYLSRAVTPSSLLITGLSTTTSLWPPQRSVDTQLPTRYCCGYQSHILEIDRASESGIIVDTGQGYLVAFGVGCWFQKGLLRCCLRRERLWIVASMFSWLAAIRKKLWVVGSRGRDWWRSESGYEFLLPVFPKKAGEVCCPEGGYQLWFLERK